MLIHRKNSYAPGGKQRTDRREVQSRGPGLLIKNIFCILHASLVMCHITYTRILGRNCRIVSSLFIDP
jgi:hypothetical protein